MRSLDPTPFNTIANHLSVQSWVGVSDLTVTVQNPHNYCFLTESKNGAYTFHNHGNGHYVVHAMALPEARGKSMHTLLKQVFDFMFIETDCVSISTVVPLKNEKALKWAHVAGLKPTFQRIHPLAILDGEPSLCQFLELTWNQYITNPAQALLRCTMVGNGLKAIPLYNQWAMLVGEPPAIIINTNPMLLNMGAEIIQITSQGANILKS